jgi:hypothetical protein
MRVAEGVGDRPITRYDSEIELEKDLDYACR